MKSDFVMRFCRQELSNMLIIVVRSKSAEVTSTRHTRPSKFREFHRFLQGKVQIRQRDSRARDRMTEIEQS